MAAKEFNYEIARNPSARFRQLGTRGKTWYDVDASVPRRAVQWVRRGTGNVMMRFGDWVARVGSRIQ